MDINPKDLELVDRLHAEFARSGAWAAIEEGDFLRAKELLVQLVVNGDLFDMYLNRMHEKGECQTPAFAAADLDYDAECGGIVDAGVDAVTPQFLGRVLLDPAAILNIHMAVDKETPASWRSALVKNSQELRASHKLQANPVPLLGRQREQATSRVGP